MQRFRFKASSAWVAFAIFLPALTQAKDSLMAAANKRSTRETNDRIVGGNDATIADNSWQVALLLANRSNNLNAQFCGGVIVAPEWILTAAHCIDVNFAPESIEVLSGTDDLSVSGTRSKVKAYFVNPDYVSSTKEADLALIRIDSSGPSLVGAPISGAARDDELTPKATQIRVSGWGVTERRYQPTIKMQAVDLTLRDTAECNSNRSYRGKVLDGMFCAGEVNGGKDTCEGDSGGPATAMVNSKRRLVGVVSWGDPNCAAPGVYGVYVRVVRYLDWIRTTTQGVVNL